MEATSFISTKISSKLFKLLTKSLKSSIDQRNKELVRINDVFGNCLELAKYYVQPSCQQVNPAHELEDETISTIRAEVFETINKFFHRDIVTRDGASQMFILADAGMGKTSLLMMIKLSHLMSFWPKDYQCQLLKLGEDTLTVINNIENKSKTILLLDSLDEDVQCKKGGTIERLTKILEATTHFYRVIITCRTQFFPETVDPAFNTLGKISFRNYDCPLIYLSLFTTSQVDSYLKKRYPKKIKFIFNGFDNPKKANAKAAIQSISSLQFRPFLLSHVEILLESYKSGASEYELYKGLVNAWLNREVIKLRKYHSREVNKEDLLKACIWLAERMQRQATHTVALKHIKQICYNESNIVLLEDSADRVIEGIDHIDIGTNSLLNRNSYGEFRFSHLSIREFLIVYGIELGVISDKHDPFHKTDKMLTFIKTVNRLKFGLFFNEKKGYLLTGFEIKDSNQLASVDLKYASLDKSNLERASLSKACLKGASFRNANLRNANLKEANFEGANLQDADLTNADLTGANLQGANLQGASIAGSNFENADLSNSVLVSVSGDPASPEFKAVCLKNTKILQADLSQASLEGADLTNAVLTGAKLVSANLSCANLNFSKLSKANLKSSLLCDASLKNAELIQADLAGADLTNSNLLDAEMEACDISKTRLTGSNISESQRKEAIVRKHEYDKSQI